MNNSKSESVKAKSLLAKAVSFILLFGIIFSSLAFSPNTKALDYGLWSDYVDTLWYDDGNYDVYLIDNARQLAGLAEIVNSGTDTFENKTIRLTGNIDLSSNYWVPIGLDNTSKKNSINKFKGTFDGQGYMIQNMLIDQKSTGYEFAGLFGVVENAIIERVNIDTGSYLHIEPSLDYKLSSMQVGAIVGSACKSSIHECVNNGVICIEPSSDISCTNAGGIAGYAYETIIRGCINNGKISSNSNFIVCAGGIVSSSSKTKIFNCINNGEVKVSSTKCSYAGGILSKSNNSTTTVINCSNTAKVCSEGEGKSSTGGIGGMAVNLVAINCINSGKIFSNIINNVINSSAAGIIGEVYSNCLDDKTKIHNCVNIGEINVASARRSCVGGICGFISNCNNYEISNTFYNGKLLFKNKVNCKRPLGLGSIADYKQQGTLSLPESQLTASRKAKPEKECSEINNSHAVANNLKKDSLIDILNAEVKYLNETENYGIQAAYWEQIDGVNGNYPYLNDNWTTRDLENNFIYANTDWYYNNFDSDSNEYTIKTAEDLAGLAKLVNIDGIDFSSKTIILLNQNIDLGGHNWEPIGTKENPFNGAFDGNEKIIYNMRISNDYDYEYVGLFGYVEGATIQNLTIGKGSCVYSFITTKKHGYFVGGIAGGIKDSKINKCTNNGCILALENTKFHACVGGICGSVRDNSTVENCINYGDISSGREDSSGVAVAGGIVGTSDGDDERIEIKNCSNAGNITSKSSECTSNSGGIVGTVFGFVSITGCTNSEDTQISAIGNLNLSAVAGGITAVAVLIDESEVEHAPTITACENRGNVSSNVLFYDELLWSSAEAGGIVAKTLYAIIKECKNYGNINAESQTFANVGGVVASTDNTKVNNCDNYGKLSSNCTSEMSTIGGIVGITFRRSTEIIGCNNKNIKDSNNVIETKDSLTALSGGICGNVHCLTDSLIISDCVNEMKIYSASSSQRENQVDKEYAKAGGILGGLYNSDAGKIIKCNITNCTNSGDVLVESDNLKRSFADGIIGYFENSEMTIDGCNNTAKIINNGTESNGDQ